MNIEIRKLNKKDIDQAIKLVGKVIKDSFIYQGLTGKEYDPIIESEIQNQVDRFNRSFITNDTVILVAKKDDKVIGSIGFTNPTDSVIKASQILGGSYPKLVELVSAYVQPDFQRIGLGQKLVREIIEQMKIHNLTHFGLSTGYIKGRAFWTKLFGQVTIILPKYYNGKEDCWIWIIPVE